MEKAIVCAPPKIMEILNFWLIGKFKKAETAGSICVVLRKSKFGILHNGQKVRVDFTTIKKILENISVKVEIGGGIRTLEKADALLKLGAYRVIFGTAAVKNPSLIEEAVKQHNSENIAVAIDEKDGKVAVHGWKNKSEKCYLDFARSFEKMGVGALIFTPISVDGYVPG